MLDHSATATTFVEICFMARPSAVCVFSYIRVDHKILLECTQPSTACPCGFYIMTLVISMAPVVAVHESCDHHGICCGSATVINQMLVPVLHAVISWGNKLMMQDQDLIGNGDAASAQWMSTGGCFLVVPSHSF